MIRAVFQGLGAIDRLRGVAHRGVALLVAMSVTLFTALLSGAAAAAPAAQQSDGGGSGVFAVDPGWPRTFTKDGTTLVIHQPQVDAWQNHDRIKFRCVVEVTLAGTDQPQLGVVAVQANTHVRELLQQVVLRDIQVVAVRFPDLPPEQAAALKAVVMDMLPNQNSLTIALQRVTASLHDQAMPQGVPLNLNPPPIFFSATPAVLVNSIGPLQFKPLGSAPIMWAVNTNWVLLLDVNSSLYYLLVGKSWLQAPDPVNGPWTAAGTLPASFSQIPTNDQWQDVVAAVPGQPMSTVPTVFTSTEPAELILTNGPPSCSPITGTSLMYVTNPEQPVFLQVSTQTYYYLVAGRWFSAPSLSGPWSAASANLPADFARIPESSPMAFVLPSVPGTAEAKDAILIAQVPKKATINIEGTTVNVQYDGAPKFAPIQGTSMQYAVNTAYQVVNANNQFYCCHNGVWFVAPAATGPWTVCTAVPSVIYTIPPTSPVYNTTYVKVYSATPSTVTVGYTEGYNGAYVAATGALMFGAGMLVGAAIADDGCCWHGCYPCYYSYGCAPYWHGGYCGYYSAGGYAYGPNGGAGWHAGYNPSTGNYYRGGAVATPYGARWGGQAYSPWTNTYGAHTGGTNGYQSWGHSYVQQGSNWAEAGHESTARGGVGYAENSSGGWAEGVHSNRTDSSFAQTSSGNMYAGHDGNVYKNTGDGWESYNNGSWNQVQKPSSGWPSQSSQATQASQQWQQKSQQAQSEWKNNFNSSNLQSHWDSASSSGGGLSGWQSHDQQNSLNRDSWSRNFGNGGSSGWGGDRSSGGWGGGDHSFGGGGFGQRFGGGFGRFRR
ncbi:MAG: hypothetical protein KF724_02590 [Phycisphaeraceae bacterium]|nr:hypothetical protein [Phycisphaeraceae bacterium]